MEGLIAGVLLFSAAGSASAAVSDVTSRPLLGISLLGLSNLLAVFFAIIDFREGYSAVIAFAGLGLNVLAATIGFVVSSVIFYKFSDMPDVEDVESKPQTSYRS